MKKIISILLVLILVLSMAACGGKDSSEGNAEAKGDTMTLEEIMTDILTDVELPDVMSVELTEEDFEFFTFAAYQDGLEGLASDALISAIAHSVVLVRAEDEETAESVAEEMDTNKDPRKWMCVEAEKSEVIVNGCTILLVMSSEAAATAIADNFNALWIAE